MSETGAVCDMERLKTPGLIFRSLVELVARFLGLEGWVKDIIFEESPVRPGEAPGMNTSQEESMAHFDTPTTFLDVIGD